MNSFIQMLLGQAKRSAPVGFQQAVKRIGPITKDLTDPNTYRGLAARAENTLRRGLPPQFAGANFGRIPAQATGLISDIAEMPQGLARNIQSGMASRAIREMAGDIPRVPAAIQQASSGALRAPVIGDAVQAGRNVMTGITGGLTSPTGFGGAFARDPGLRREFLKQFGGTSQKAAQALANVRSPGGITGLGGPFSVGLTAGLAIPGAIDAATSIYEAGEGIIRGGLGADNLRASLRRQNTPGYQGYEPARTFSVGSERFGPFSTGTVASTEGAAPPGGAPSAPILPPPSTYGGGQTGYVPQAGRATPSVSMSPMGPGVVSNGAGVPAQRQNVIDRALSQEVLNAAQQYNAPANVPLSSFYAGQQQLGRSMEQTGELQRQLKEMGGAAGMNDQALMQWAQANPGLAYRELQKLKSRM